VTRYPSSASTAASYLIQQQRTSSVHMGAMAVSTMVRIMWKKAIAHVIRGEQPAQMDAYQAAAPPQTGAIRSSRSLTTSATAALRSAATRTGSQAHAHGSQSI
jgi:hypothetical protein